MALPDETYYNVQTNSDLVYLVGQYLQLSPGRKAHKGTCPFHDDPAQSLMVSPDKNIFKCFGCGKEGGPVEFLKDIKGIKLEEAVNQLLSRLSPVHVTPA
jgi:DNA primase